MKLIRKMVSAIILFTLTFSVFYPMGHVHAEEDFAMDVKQKAGLDFFFCNAENIDSEVYGGAYFDENGNLVMLYTNYDPNVKSVGDSVISEAQNRDFVDIKRVIFSYMELKNYLNILIEELDFSKTRVDALDIDIINNKVQIFIEKLDNEKVKTISSIVPIEAIDFVEGEVINIEDEITEDYTLTSNCYSANAKAATITLTPGQKICYGKYSASLFLPGVQWLKDSYEYEQGFLTAGHISASEGDAIYDADNNLIGTVARKLQTNTTDVALIKGNPDYNYQNGLLNGEYPLTMYALKEDYGIPVNTKLTVYSYLGNKTGLLVSNNYTYVNADKNIVWGNMIRTTISTSDGYSGAPVAIDDSSYTDNKVIVGYHKGRAIVDNKVYAFHGNLYYVIQEIPDLKFVK